MRGVLHSHTSDAEKAPESAITLFPPAPGLSKRQVRGRFFVGSHKVFPSPEITVDKRERDCHNKTVH